MRLRLCNAQVRAFLLAVAVLLLGAANSSIRNSHTSIIIRSAWSPDQQPM